jgi:hypothetical protein
MGNVKSVKVVRIDSQLIAFGHLASYVFYVLTHPLTPISLLTIGLMGWNGFSLGKYFTTEQAKVQKVEPLSDNRTISLMPEAIAGEKRDSILIDGKLYGFSDPDVESWKLSGKPTILIHQRSTGAIFTVEVEALNPNRMKSYK